MNSKAFYYSLTFVVPLSFFVSSVYLPIWLEKISLSAVGPAIAAYYVGQIAAILFIMVVRVPNKLAPAALFVSALSILSFLTLNEEVIIVSRILGGVAAGLFSVILIEFSILISRGSKDSGRFYSFVNFLNATPAVVGPLISAVIFALVGISNIFILSAGLLIASSVLCLPLLRLQTPNDQKKSSNVMGLLHLLKKNALVYFAYFSEMFLFMYWIVFVPLRMNQLGHANAIGLVFGVEALIYTLLQLVNVKIIDFVKNKFWAFLIAYFLMDVLLTLVTSFLPFILLFLLVAAVSFPLTPVLYTRNAEGTEDGLEQSSSAVMTLMLRVGWATGALVAAAIFVMLA